MLALSLVLELMIATDYLVVGNINIATKLTKSKPHMFSNPDACRGQMLVFSDFCTLLAMKRTRVWSQRAATRVVLKFANAPVSRSVDQSLTSIEVDMAGKGFIHSFIWKREQLSPRVLELLGKELMPIGLTR